MISRDGLGVGVQAAAEVLGAAYAAATPYEVVDHHVSRPSSTLALTTFPAAVSSRLIAAMALGCADHQDHLI